MGEQHGLVNHTTFLQRGAHQLEIISTLYKHRGAYNLQLISATQYLRKPVWFMNSVILSMYKNDVIYCGIWFSSITEVAATVTRTTQTEITETKCVMFPDQPVVGGSLPVMGWTDSQLGHSQTANVVCVTELPVFTSDKLEVGLLLYWKEMRGNNFRTRYGGQVQLTVGEVYSSSLCCNPITDWCHPLTERVCQDQMAYLVTHQITEVCL